MNMTGRERAGPVDSIFACQRNKIVIKRWRIGCLPAAEHCPPAARVGVQVCVLAAAAPRRSSTA